ISCVTLPANPEALVALGLGGPRPTPSPAAPSTPSPARTPGAPGAANSKAARALAQAALGELIAARLRYHLGLLN
ncbi:MAG: hypothetical protein KQI62_17065, partial [Deltaproteobacteria bacterium]|nr:hypothetical protein [Deltaproteobacteria bacterium]